MIIGTNRNAEQMPDNFVNTMQNNIIMPRINETPTIRQYFNEESNDSNNSGYIENMKVSRNVRILLLNPHRCRPHDNDKMHIIKQSIVKYQIDIVMLNETNTKWDTRNISKIEQQIREIDREALIIIAESNE